ncbi:aldehyde dehydrogenase family protein [Tabrizicola sp.]|uniref:aldehyde dehydrogenase family protein n=1 Tax=Tabrizicola sp. TaxID=2005166 RepID=UPI002FDE1CB9
MTGHLPHLIGGQPVFPSGLASRRITNPATEAPLGSFYIATPAVVDAAVSAARMALPCWMALSPGDRAGMLRACAESLAANAEDHAHRITQENGKPLTEARGEVQGALEEIHGLIGLSLHLRSGKQMSRAGDLSFQQVSPRGVVACITPWNYPFLTPLVSVFAALVTGNTVVLKPSEKSPNSVLAPILSVAGHLPAGVLNVVLGDGGMTGAALVEDARVDFVLFVGSTRAGAQIALANARNLRPAAMELGGKDCFIVDAGADLDQAVAAACHSAFYNAGQICTSAERFLVHSDIHAEFSRRLAVAAAQIALGDGMALGTRMGPLIDRGQRDLVAAHVEDALQSGARLLTGGQIPDGPGFFYPPTVLTDVSATSRLWREETFGPVAPILEVPDFETALRVADDSDYGLGAVLFTQNAAHALRAIEVLDVGILKINTPIGVGSGTTWEPRRKSGFGPGNGQELLQALLRQKSVTWRALNDH